MEQLSILVIAGFVLGLSVYALTLVASKGVCMSPNKPLLFFCLPCLLLFLAASNPRPQIRKSEVLSLMSELNPVVTGTPDKPHVTEPGYEVEKRVVDNILSIAGKSPEMEQLVTQTLVDLLEDLTHKRDLSFSLVFRGACNVLGQLKAVDAIDVLSRNLDKEHGVASLSFNNFPAVKAIIEIGKPSVPRLAEVLLSNASKPENRYLAAFALGEIGYEQSRDALERAESTETDPEVLKAIKLALGVVQRSKVRQ